MDVAIFEACIAQFCITEILLGDDLKQACSTPRVVSINKLAITNRQCLQNAKCKLASCHTITKLVFLDLTHASKPILNALKMVGAGNEPSDGAHNLVVFSQTWLFVKGP